MVVVDQKQARDSKNSGKATDVYETVGAWVGITETLSACLTVVLP